MLRLFVPLLIVLHALIHLLGFAKEWKLARVPQLSGYTLFPLNDTTTKMMGTLWLVAFLAFAVAAGGFLARKEWWWIVTAGAVGLSQFLIVILASVVVSYAAWFPTSALSPYTTWETIDSLTARATMSFWGMSASGVYSFNDAGEVIGFEAQRYGEY